MNGIKKYILILGLFFCLPYYEIFAEEMSISYKSHVENYGWMNDVDVDEISGTVGEGKRLEAYRIVKNDSNISGDILYRSYVNGIGWQEYVSSGNISGTTGQGKKLEMIQIKLTEDMAQKYDIYYRVHVSNKGWLDWACNDQITGTLGYNYQIEAYEIKLIKKGDEIPTNTTNIYLEKKLAIAYRSHVENYGWMNFVDGGKISGTVGKSKRLEAYKIIKSDSSISGDILYRSYVNGIGWQEYVSSGNISGTTGQGKKLEMIQIKLTEDMAQKYDIYYRVHVSNKGWLDWACNDQITGTLGYNYQIEAYEIKLIKKGDEIPSNTSSIYFKNNVSLDYQSYSGKTWHDLVEEGNTTGSTGESTAINGFKIYVNDGLLNDWILYRSYVHGTGWQEYVSGGGISGSTKDSKIELIQIKMNDYVSDLYDVYYRVHVSNKGWLDWACNNQITGTLGFNYQIEALEIKLVKKGEGFSENIANIYFENTNYLTYTSHMENYGWGNNLNGNEVTGVINSGKRMEAISISLSNKSLEGSIKYSAHVEKNGWMNYVSDGEIAGTVGEGKRLEAIKIELTGELANKYDIYYRTFVQDNGWLDWAKNGEIAGSISISKRIEGMQIVLVEKGGVAPGNVGQSYLDSIFRVIDGKIYYYSNGIPVTGFKTIDGIKYFFNSSGVLVGKGVKEIIDVSVYQGNIDWNQVSNNTDVDGAIVRLGYGTSYVEDAPVIDSRFTANYTGALSSNLLFGVYIYSYAIDAASAEIEANFVINTLNERNHDKSKAIYYDLESNPWTKDLTSSDYDIIIKTFINKLVSAGYKVQLYTYKYWAETKFSDYAKSQLGWIAQYASDCTYNGTYYGWQYTDSGSVSGINGNVDISVWKN